MIKYYLFYFVFILCLLSCTTERKVLHFMSKKSEFRLKYLADNCTVKEETKYITKDSLIEKTIEVKGDSIPCPPNEKGEVIKVKCPDKVVKCVDTIRTITITKTVELKDKQIYLEKELDKQKDRADKAEKSANKLRNWLMALICIFGISIYLKIKGIF